MTVKAASPAASVISRTRRGGSTRVIAPTRSHSDLPRNGHRSIRDDDGAENEKERLRIAQDADRAAAEQEISDHAAADRGEAGEHECPEKGETFGAGDQDAGQGEGDRPDHIEHGEPPGRDGEAQQDGPTGSFLQFGEGAVLSQRGQGVVERRDRSWRHLVGEAQPKFGISKVDGLSRDERLVSRRRTEGGKDGQAGCDEALDGARDDGAGRPACIAEIRRPARGLALRHERRDVRAIGCFPDEPDSPAAIVGFLERAGPLTRDDRQAARAQEHIVFRAVGDGNRFASHGIGKKQIDPAIRDGSLGRRSPHGKDHDAQMRSPGRFLEDLKIDGRIHAVEIDRRADEPGPRRHPGGAEYPAAVAGFMRRGRSDERKGGNEPPEGKREARPLPGPVHGRRLALAGLRRTLSDYPPEDASCDNFSISHHEQRSGIEPLTGSARSVPIAPFRFAAIGWLRS